MAITGTNSANQDMALKVEELYLDGTKITATGAEINKLGGAGTAIASGTQASNIADADTTPTINSTFSSTEVAAAIGANATTINSILDALEAFGIMAAS